ncbi:HAD family hydrolase [bacterium]|nr:HAD family hydrolase [bacterium]
MSRRAVFLDRDGTIIRESHFLHRPEDVELLPGVANSLKRLHEAGYALVVLSNQSGVARGLFDLAAVAAVNQELERQLAEQGISLDGIYICPHHPEAESKEFGIVCNCRKPAPGLALQAAEELDLDLEGSWMMGDKPDDVLLSQTLPLRAILLRTGYGRAREGEVAHLAGLHRADDMESATDWILETEGLS